jgi:hypothetical protein
VKPSVRIRVATLLSGVFFILVSMLTLPTASAGTLDNPSCWAVPLSPNGARAGCNTFAWGERVRAVIDCEGGYRRYGRWVSRSEDFSQIYCDRSSHDRLGYTYEVVIDTSPSP